MTDSAPPPDKVPADFDWLVFADATFAGLSVLIPIPLIDSLFEGIFRRRMAASIARRRQVAVSPAVLRHLEREGCSPAGCLLWPLKQAVNLLGRISRKILYFLTIKEAADQLSYYWHRAFLLDYMLAASHLDEAAPPDVARQALARTLRETTTGPLNQLAAQVVGNTHHALRSLWRVFRRRRDSVLDDHRATMGKRWDEYRDYWLKLIQRYETTYAAELAAFRQAEATARAAAAAADGDRR